MGLSRRCCRPFLAGAGAEGWRTLEEVSEDKLELLSVPPWLGSAFTSAKGNRSQALGTCSHPNCLHLSPGSITCLLVTLGKFLTAPCLSFLFYKMGNILVPTFESIL